MMVQVISKMNNLKDIKGPVLDGDFKSNRSHIFSQHERALPDPREVSPPYYSGIFLIETMWGGHLSQDVDQE